MQKVKLSMIKTIKKIVISVIFSFSLVSLTSTSFAADATVEMLNKKGNESMVFSQKIVNKIPIFLIIFVILNLTFCTYGLINYYYSYNW